MVMGEKAFSSSSEQAVTYYIIFRNLTRIFANEFIRCVMMVHILIIIKQVTYLT